MKIKMKLSYERKKSYYGYLFISVWLIGFILLFLIPFISSVRYSLSEVSIQPGQVGMKPVGLKNYIELFTKNAEFLPAFTKTITSVIAKMPLILIFSIFIAVILNQNFHGRALARAIFFLPVIISGGIAIEIMNGNFFLGLISGGNRASAMFETQSVGNILLSAGLSPSTVDYIQGTVDSVFQLAWNSGIQILIFLAGLQSIPGSMYEVAQVEGSNGWITFWKVTMPMLAPMLIVNVFYTLVDNMISYSNEMFRLIDTYTNNLYFDEAAAMAIINFIVIMLMVLLIYLSGNRRIHYAVD